MTSASFIGWVEENCKHRVHSILNGSLRLILQNGETRGEAPLRWVTGQAALISVARSDTAGCLIFMGIILGIGPRLPIMSYVFEFANAIVESNHQRLHFCGPSRVNLPNLKTVTVIVRIVDRMEISCSNAIRFSQFCCTISVLLITVSHGLLILMINNIWLQSATREEQGTDEIMSLIQTEESEDLKVVKDTSNEAKERTLAGDEVHLDSPAEDPLPFTKQKMMEMQRILVKTLDYFKQGKGFLACEDGVDGVEETEQSG
ncbi:hypothetical protein HUJ04_007712 [Dendroctonus ponderosae]|nr:hypothetical protein HUJ04_007712 [Dendroctonus ponderosae]